MDDDEMVQYILSQMLGHLGYAASFAAEGSQAVAMYRAAADGGEPFDAVILDLSVKSGMGGIETISALQTAFPDVKALVSSGFSTDPVMTDYAAYGFCGVLEKPYHMETLEETLGRVFRE